MNIPLFKKILLGIICTTILCPARLYAQNQNKVVDAQGTEQILYRQSYALLIGASDYTAGWPDLPGVEEDIAAIEKILKKHNFIVTKVSNPDRRDLDTAFENFINNYGLDEGNRLLVYFAGHGYTVTKKYGEEMGYIVPVDAPNPHNDEKGFISKAMPIERIELFAKRIDAKHALFIFDSCFSGSIFSLSRAIPASITDKTSKPVRQFITSGDANEEVPDVSVFRQQFVSALSGEGDSNGDGYLTGSELGSFLTDTVINYSENTQHPQYGKIRNPHLNKGDFVFIIPQEKSSPQTASKDNNQKAGDAVSGDGEVISERAELMFWDTIKNSSNPADFKAYLEQFPQGKFTGLAIIRSKGTAVFNTEKPFAVKNSDRKGADVLLLNNQATEAAEKNAENARIAREQEAVRKKTEEERIARERETAIKRTEEKRKAQQLEAERKRLEKFIIAREREALRKRIEATRIASEQEAARKKTEEERRARERETAIKRTEEKRKAQQLEAAEKNAENARVASEQEAVRKKTEEERIARERETAIKRTEEKRKAQQLEAAEKNTEKARVASEQEVARKKTEEERIGKERETAIKRAEEKHKAQQLEAEKIAEKARIANEPEDKRHQEDKTLQQYKDVLASGFEAVQQKSYAASKLYYNQAKQMSESYDLPKGELIKLEEQIKELGEEKNKRKPRILYSF